MSTKRFVIRLIVFFAPFMLSFGAIVIFGYYIGELAPMTHILDLQRSSDEIILYGPAWQDQDNVHYKYRAVLAYQPEVLVLGSSRVLHFRDQFNNLAPHQFYNAGVPTLDLAEMELFLNGLKADHALPEVLILGIDLFNFNKNYPTIGERVQAVVPTSADERNRINVAIRRVFQFAMRNSADISLTWHSVNAYEGYDFLGLNVVEDQLGFRPDGSRYLGAGLDRDIDARIAPQLEFYEKGQQVYTPASADEFEEAALQALDRILHNAQEWNLPVIGVLLPYQESIYNRMMASGKYEYISVALPQIEAMFAQYSDPFYNFVIPQTVGGTDAELYDTLHAGELLSLRMFTAIVRDHPEIFASYVDVDALDQVMLNADNPFYLYSRPPE